MGKGGSTFLAHRLLTYCNCGRCRCRCRCSFLFLSSADLPIMLWWWWLKFELSLACSTVAGKGKNGKNWDELSQMDLWRFGCGLGQRGCARSEEGDEEGYMRSN